MAFARQYYGCDDIQGVYLDNEGGSGTTKLDISCTICHTENMKCFVIITLVLIGKRELLIMKQ